MSKKGRKFARRGLKWLVQRHGRGEKRSADREERAIEKRERRAARKEIEDATS